MRLLIAFTLLCLGEEATFAQQVPYDSIKRVLDTIRSFDQGYRSIQQSILAQPKLDEKAYHQNAVTIAHYDSINLAKLDIILTTYGWPGIQDIGEEGSQTIFMVVQHAEVAHQKKYVEILKRSVESNFGKKSALAVLEDKICVAEGRPQIFGTQVGMNTDTKLMFVFPLIDPENVDERRHEYDLPPMQEFLDRYYLTWNPKQYKADLPKLQAMLHGKVAGY
jgi:hypothetical protein